MPRRERPFNKGSEAGNQAILDDIVLYALLLPIKTTANRKSKEQVSQ